MYDTDTWHLCIYVYYIYTIYCTNVSRGNKRDRDHQRGKTRHGHVIYVCVYIYAYIYIFGTYISRGKKETMIIGGGNFNTVMQFIYAYTYAHMYIYIWYIYFAGGKHRP